MSLIKLREPIYISPVNNPLPIIYKSTLSNNNGFRYRIDLIVNDILETSTFIYPDDKGYGVFDCSQIVSDLIEKKVYYDVTGKTDTLLKYNYIITEFLGNVSGDTYSGYTDFYAFKGVTQYGKDWVLDDYIEPNVSSSFSKFLSTKKKRKFKLNEYATLSHLFDIEEPWYTHYFIIGLTILTHDYHNVSHDYTCKISDDVFKPTMITTQIGPKGLNDIVANGDMYLYHDTGSTVTSDIIHNGIKSYEIFLERIPIDNTTGEMLVWTPTEFISIDVDNNCYKHDGIQFIYLGYLGSYESYTATQGDIKSFEYKWTEIKRRYYQVNEYTDGLTEVKYNYEIGDRGREIVDKRITESYSVVTDWLSDDESKDLMELIDSTDVYIVRDDNLYPIIITNGKMQEKNKKTNKLYNYTITFEMAYEKLSNK